MLLITFPADTVKTMAENGVIRCVHFYLRPNVPLVGPKKTNQYEKQTGLASEIRSEKQTIPMPKD